MDTTAARLDLAARIATATGGKLWNKGDCIRVYTSRPGQKPSYYSIPSPGRIEYDRANYQPLVDAGIVALTDISTPIV